jgi:predicted aldo/keto reductase-like oxidoreductase
MPAKVSDRRRFLTGALSAVTAGLVARPSRVASGEAETPARIGREHYVTLGRTGVSVSPVAAGLSLKASDLVAAADAGINYFDTAEKYLNLEHNRMVGQALKGRERKTIFVSAKFQDGLQKELTASTDEIVTRVNQCLERLGTDYIDCMLIHNVQNPDALENPKWFAAYERLKGDGKVRFLGASTHDPKLSTIVARIIQSNHYDLMLLAYNPTTDGDLYGSRGWPAIPKLLEEAGRKRIAVSTMKVMIGAVAAGKAKGVGPDGIDPNDIKARSKYLDARIAATRWVLSNPNVHVVQYTMTGPETVAAAVKAATTRFTEKDKVVATTYHHAARGQGCPVPCPAPCVDACPAEVAIPDVLRHRMYYEHFGLQKQAMLEYAALPPAQQARVCLDCPSQACVQACPEGRPVKDLTRGTHSLLTLA